MSKAFEEIETDTLISYKLSYQNFFRSFLYMHGKMLVLGGRGDRILQLMAFCLGGIKKKKWGESGVRKIGVRLALDR